MSTRLLLFLLVAGWGLRGSVRAQNLSFDPIRIPISPKVTYASRGQIIPTPLGWTNVQSVIARNLFYGDKIRLRTVGSFAVSTGKDDQGNLIFPAETPHPILGLYAGVFSHFGANYQPYQSSVTELPQFTTPSRVSGTTSIPTDTPNDFLITPEGVTLCVPVLANFLYLLNPDPNAITRDLNSDFALEILPLEKARPNYRIQVASTNVLVGEDITVDILIGNEGNVPAYGFGMYLDAQLAAAGLQAFSFNTNLLTQVSGPVPATIPSLAPGESSQIRYVLHSIAPGTNYSYIRIGRTVCGDQYFQAYANSTGPIIIRPLVDLTLRRPTAGAYTPESIEAGKTDSDAPLVCANDEGALGNQPEFTGQGLIADGVTPLLLRLEADPAALKDNPDGFKVTLEGQLTSGTLDGPAIGDRLQVLQDGVWIGNGELALTPAHPIRYAMLLPVTSDTVRPAAPEVEVTGQLTVRDETKRLLSRKEFKVRRPPIALIHGYNTDGSWGPDFVLELARSRSAAFVPTARYGQDNVTSPTTGRQAAVNTVATFVDLAPLALQSLRDAVDPLRSDWIFTRHDVVCHSQGGILTRMLCSKNANDHVAEPFRNAGNYYRGRFHRVVTIGSPHNGTRLLRYLLTLNGSSGGALPDWVGYGMVASDTAQAKFDPWGPQIALVNDPSPSAPWAPDPAARFHLVRTLILGGKNYASSFSECPAFAALGILTPTAGSIVVGPGADGVVDFASMLAVGPGGAPPPNSFSVAVENRIAHAAVRVPGLGEIFGAETGQVQSPVVARHVIATLDQDSAIPAADRVFGSFSLPPQLQVGVRDGIDSLARSYEITDENGSWDVPFPQQSLARHEGASAAPAAGAVRTATLKLTEPAGFPAAGPVLFIAQLYNQKGISGDGVQVSPVPGDPLRATISVDASVFGDLVLQAMYDTAAGKRVFIRPYVAASWAPAGTTVRQFEIVPGSGTRFAPGIAVPVEVWTTWSDGQRSRRFAGGDRLQVTSSAPGVVDVTDPLVWRTGNPGLATMTAGFGGLTATAVWQVSESSGAIRLAIRPTGPSTFELSWPRGVGDAYRPQYTDRADGGSVWLPIATPPVASGDRWTVTVPAGPAARSYRLRKPL